MKVRFVRHATLQHMVNGESEVGITFDDQHIRNSRKRGFAAYAEHNGDGKGGVIHYWFSHEVPHLKRLEILAHEVGHLTGVSFLDGVLEEERADGYGRAATRAYKEITRK